MELLGSLAMVPVCLGLCFYALFGFLFIYDKIFLFGSFLIIKSLIDRNISFESYYLEWKSRN